MKQLPEILCNFEELRKNSRLNKHQHFSAAERVHRQNILCGVPVVLTNVFLGSVLFISLSEAVPDATIWLGGFLALGAAFCSGLQTFFNFEKMYEGHRKIANRYLQIQRNCEIAKSEFIDNIIDEVKLSCILRVILDEYNAANCEAEAYHTGKTEYKRALDYDKKKCQEDEQNIIRKRLEASVTE